MSLELLEKTDINQLVYELSSVKDLVNSLPNKCIIEEVTGSEDISDIYLGLRKSSLLIYDLFPNEIETVQIYSTLINEDEYSQSFIIGCTMNNALFQLRIVTDGLGKIDKVLIEQYRDSNSLTITCEECIKLKEFEMAMVLKDILTKEVVK